MTRRANDHPDSTSRIHGLPETGVTRETLQALFKGFPLPAYAWKKRKDDFILIDYNEAAFEITSGKIGSLVGTTLADAYTPESEVFKDINRVYSQGGSIQREMDYTFLSTGKRRRLKATYTSIKPDLVLVYTEDVTDLTQSIRQLEEERSLFRTLVEGISEALIAVDAQGKIYSVNTSATQMFGYSAREMVGQPVEMLVPDGKQIIHKQHRQTYMQAPRTREMGHGLSLSARNKQGHTFPVEIGLNAISTAGKISVIALVSDITERKKNEDLLLKAARTDALTRLINRRACEDLLSAEENRVERGAEPFSLVLADIDFFKHVNDTYGHNIGDEVLLHIARLIHTHIRRADTAARWGGEEFLILLPETEIGGAAALAEKLREVVESSPALTSSGEIRVTMSFGTAEYSGETIDKVINRADKRLYQAKSAGRNKVVSRE